MPRIDFAMLAQSVKRAGETMTIIGADQNVLGVSFFPAQLNFDLVWRITAGWNESGVAYALVIEVIDGDGKPILPVITRSVIPAQNSFAGEGAEASMVFNATMENLPIERAGTYYFRLSMAGSPSITEPFTVYEVGTIDATLSI